MTMTDTARANGEAFFPGRLASLEQTDPELTEVFADFAFDEVLEHTELDPRVRLLVQLASTIACQALAVFRTVLEGALSVGVTPVEAKEVVYQAVPYVGMAKVLDFVHATNEVLTARGIALPLGGQATTTREDRRVQGLELQKRLVGDAGVERMRSSAPADAFRFQEFLAGNCFGDHVSRGGLDLRTRELLTFAMLVSLGGCEAQAKGHVAANLRVGNDRASLIGVLTQLVPFIGYPRTLNGLAVVDEVAPAPTGS